MTNKEAINMLSMIKVDKTGEFEPLHTWYGGIDKDMQEAVELAKKALSQPDIEAIRQEIENMPVLEDALHMNTVRKYKVLSIIDNHIQKGENKK